MSISDVLFVWIILFRYQQGHYGRACSRLGDAPLYVAQFTDYLLPSHLNILPIEVKAGSQGGMKSLWSFMREKHITEAVRCSLENFGEFGYIDKEDADTVRHVNVFPLYAVSQIIRSTTSKPQE